MGHRHVSTGRPAVTDESDDDHEKSRLMVIKGNGDGQQTIKKGDDFYSYCIVSKDARFRVLKDGMLTYI